MGKFENKTAIVTGGSRGLGKCICEKFLREGASVVFVDIAEDLGKKTAEELSTLGQVEFKYCDISNAENVNELIQYVVLKYGKVDYMINNASVVITNRFQFHEYDPKFVKKMMEVNVYGTYLCMKYAISQMLQQENRGVIIDISSASADYADCGLGIYAASKAAINALVSNAALEYGPQNIRINAVLPGGMMTEAMQAYKEQDPENYAKSTAIVPLNRWAEPAEVANAVAWLCSDEANYVTGIKFVIDGGNSL